MSEHPILFSAPMVKAILAGTKTQTRRLVTVPWKGPTRALPYEPLCVEEDGRLMVCCDEDADSHGAGDYREASKRLRCPFGEAGDRLWVRETWSQVIKEPVSAERAWWRSEDGKPLEWRGAGSRPQVQCRQNPTNVIIYRADGEMPGGFPQKWKSSIFLPRWASRITLEVTGVRVERLQAITEGDAKSEGIQADNISKVGVPCFSARKRFADLWNTINGNRASWESNPWVWVVSFYEPFTPRAGTP
jgi:hypothetical protein